MTAARLRRQAGFSLVEVLVASAITLAVTAIACVLAVEAQGSWRADGARVDLQQRTRVAADVLARAIREAGHGPSAAGGALVRAFAPIVPRRLGARSPDPPGVHRADAFSVIRSVGESEFATLLTGAPAGAAVLDLALSPACSALPCGLAEGGHAAVFDSTGNHDVFTVVRVEGGTAVVRHHGSGTVVPYPPGSPVVPVESASYYLDPRERQLRAYDGDRSDLPLVDDVVGFDVEYFGDVRPPTLPEARSGEANCLYAADGTYQSALLPELSGIGWLAPLPARMLIDGPWCGAGNRAFDADLLRVRRVRVHLRLQAASAAVRGTDPGLFRHPGHAGRDRVADVSVVLDITPVNLDAGRHP